MSTCRRRRRVDLTVTPLHSTPTHSHSLTHSLTVTHSLTCRCTALRWSNNRQLGVGSRLPCFLPSFLPSLPSFLPSSIQLPVSKRRHHNTTTTTTTTTQQQRPATPQHDNHVPCPTILQPVQPQTVPASRGLAITAVCARRLALEKVPGRFICVMSVCVCGVEHCGVELTLEDHRTTSCFAIVLRRRADTQYWDESTDTRSSKK